MYITVRISWTFFSRLVSHRQSMKYRYMRHRNVISFGNANVYTSIYSISYIVFPTKFFFFRQVYVIPIRDYEIMLLQEKHILVYSIIENIIHSNYSNVVMFITENFMILLYAFDR